MKNTTCISRLKNYTHTFALIGICITAALGVFSCSSSARTLDSLLNSIYQKKQIVPAETLRVHQGLFIIDLHCDALLWDRNLLVPNTRGHVDLPRMREGNMALQVFTAVTKFPLGDYNRRSDRAYDVVTSLVKFQGWPERTYGSLLQRALYQAEVLNGLEKASGGTFIVIHSARQLEEYVGKRTSNRHMTAGLLGIEGAHCLEGNVDNIDLLFAAGFRLVGLTHFFDTEMSGSAHGMDKGGLTERGKELVVRMEKMGIILDFAHASQRTIEDALAITKKPIIISHTGVKGACDNDRTIPDEVIRKIAARKGVVGIGFFKKAVCGKDIEHIVESILYVTRLVGPEYVGIGSDYDGSVGVPMDVSRLAELTHGLSKAGFTEKDIGMIMGGNALRVFREVLP